ncbi:hypothetical protein ACH5RR_035262 [Cinchona calisaya]|uniref:Uncharacterized protein n=1 Tax=Cinchona calisaya TaxID=153742 RepID=A0ABD2YFD9_9GENT
MKLRDRQDRVERGLSFHKSSKGSPFQEASTHVRGDIDVAGAMFLIDSVDYQRYDTIQSPALRTGVDLRFLFETSIRHKDTLVAEFVAIAIPVGARCRDVGVALSSFFQDKGFSANLAFGPPFLNKQNGSALGVTVRKSNVVASLAQFVSKLGFQTNSAGIMHCFSTFGQVVFELSQSTKLSLLGVHKMSKLSKQGAGLGAMTIPIGMLRQQKLSETSVSEDGQQIETNEKGDLLDGSVALILESELDTSTRIGGWIEMKQSNTRLLE